MKVQRCSDGFDVFREAEGVERMPSLELKAWAEAKWPGAAPWLLFLKSKWANAMLTTGGKGLDWLLELHKARAAK